jgi:hypothetical protein
MARVVLDNLREGLYLSADYIRTNYLAETASFGTLFELYRDIVKTAQSAGVINLGASDTSDVYMVRSKHHQMFAVTGEFNANQTGTIIIPAAGIGKRIVVDYGSIRSESTTGTVYCSDSVSGKTSFKIYLSVQTSFGSAKLYLPLEENAAFLLTSTQGAKLLTYAFDYHYEVIK